jgi:hypothetical protein
MRRSRKKGQIWVETVIYTLIGLAIIGIVLAVAKPKIDDKKSEILIEQAIESLKNIDQKIGIIENAGPGNRRTVEVELGSGVINIDAEEDKISWVLDSHVQYSELDAQIGLGKLIVTTTKGNPFTVTIDAIQSADIQFEDDQTSELVKTLTKSPLPHTIIIENMGKNVAGNIIIMFRVA